MATSSPVKLPTWYRALAVTVGVLSIVLAIIVLIEPVLALWLLIFLLAFALLLMGIDRLVAGITGHPFAPMLGVMPPSQPSSSPPASSSSPFDQSPPKS